MAYKHGDIVFRPDGSSYNYIDPSAPNPSASSDPYSLLFGMGASKSAPSPYTYNTGASFGAGNTGPTSAGTMGYGTAFKAPAPAPAAAATPAAQGGYGGGTYTGQGGGANPYLAGQADSINAQRQFQLAQDLSRIRGTSALAGQSGGTRQGVAEGIATGLSNQGYSGAIANLYGADWTNQQNRNLQNDAQRNSYDLGNRQLDQSQARLGADLFTSGMSGEFDPLRYASGIYQPYTGYGTTTNNQSSGGGWQGALGGLLGGATMGRQMGWW